MKLKSALLLSALAMTTANAAAQNHNPIINSMYSADPSARVFGDTLWVYPSHDKDDALSFSMEDYHTFSTTNMKTWTDHGVIFNPTKQTKWAKEAAWAPDCICRNGKYYLVLPHRQEAHRRGSFRPSRRTIPRPARASAYFN